MDVEHVVETLEQQMKKTDQRLDTLAVQVGNIENEIFSENGEEIEVNDLLKSVHEVKNNYQNLRKELVEVQNLQKQLSSTLHVQLTAMQAKFNSLKEKLNANVPQSSGVPMMKSPPTSNVLEEK